MSHRWTPITERPTGGLQSLNVPQVDSNQLNVLHVDSNQLNVPQE
ncbi:unnamed protein product, partial [Staurois parvus]